ncbi:hypothetical protein PPROV_000090500 [Pycnococcus provasolii]|uniref:RING-type domain-containing protein n=1 Tax=Pycnococcus provasolii TaxID=41880 RepID=A0A830H6B5_9CHLO|nr:hypothetical protein PPROV_000090500 [Pycnococcus provasolii]|mmetsp:Transcript_5794/g.13072  ORF Transcript_5794/g.13072 Transcript_5794/m.13072 type:complete len:175 (+) Transcript_5794:736-1260(+)
MAKKMISWNEAMKAREGKQYQPLLLESRLRREKEEAEKKEEAERPQQQQEEESSSEMDEEADLDDDETWDCAFCMERLHSIKIDGIAGDACVQTPCGHVFHGTCLRNALRAWDEQGEGVGNSADVELLMIGDEILPIGNSYRCPTCRWPVCDKSGYDELLPDLTNLTKGTMLVL